MDDIFATGLAEARAFGSNARASEVETPTIDAMIAEQAQQRPHAAAVLFDGRSWTYAELDAAATSIAAALQSRGATAGTLVGLSLPRSFEMIAALIGILRSGAAYLPLDSDLPDIRLTEIMTDAAPVLLLIGEGTQARWAACGLPTLTVEAALHERLSLPDIAPRRSADALAYILYTSGSTGQPKGVEIGHRSVVNLLRSCRMAPGIAPGDVVLAATRLGFDMSVADIFLPLSCGATLALADERLAREPKRLAQTLDTVRATVMQGTPALWRSLLDTGWEGKPDLRVWCGGEAMPRGLADQLLPRCAELWNLYGPTEVTVWSTLERVRPGDGEIGIGGPIAGTTLHILDEGLGPVAPGEVGELCIGGAGLARGYRNRPELTAERFTTLKSGERVYRTGDLARQGPDGRLYCLGRKDDQVKLRGFRVEMGEVEAALAAHPAIAWAAVRCWLDGIGENALFAYVVMKPGEEAEVDSIKAHLRATLPDYMIPAQILPMDRLPLTPNQKVDRAALPPPQSVGFRRAAIRLSRTEAQLATHWQALLGAPSIAPEDDFFDLGGYSLLTTRLLSRIEQDFGRSLSLAQLLSASTLRAMAALIETEQGTEAQRLIPLHPGAGEGPPLIWLDPGPLLRQTMRALTTRRPVIGFSLAPQDEARLDTPAMRVETVAALIADHLQAVSPATPLAIGGWCRWGLVAYEVARQLEKAGRAVDLLMLLDAENPAHPRPRSLAGQVKRVLRPAPLPPSSFSERVERVGRLYRPGFFPGDVALFQPASPAPGTSRDGGWEAVIGGRLSVYRTPGDHESMVRGANAAELAFAMDRALSA